MPASTTVPSASATWKRTSCPSSNASLVGMNSVFSSTKGANERRKSSRETHLVATLQMRGGRSSFSPGSDGQAGHRAGEMWVSKTTPLHRRGPSGHLGGFFRPEAGARGQPTPRRRRVNAVASAGEYWMPPLASRYANRIRRAALLSHCRRPGRRHGRRHGRARPASSSRAPRPAPVGWPPRGRAGPRVRRSGASAAAPDTEEGTMSPAQPLPPREGSATRPAAGAR